MGRSNSASLWLFARTILALGLVASPVAAAKTLLVLNPWDGQLGVVPQVSFDGGTTWQVTKYAPGYCGWFAVNAANTPTKVRISNGTGGVSADIPVTWINDTVFVSGALTQPVVGQYFNGQTGVCQVTNLAATIRDFDNATSTDFESATSPKGFLPGLVTTNLGPDGTPVLSADGSQSITQFPYWFHDVANVNATTCVDIPLTLDTKGLYSYYDDTYFPIDTFNNPQNNLISKPTNNTYKAKEDNKLHNFGFCLESHASFTYRQGQTFTFSGDDDVWVYINKKLVIDLGGIHTELTGTVSLDSAAASLALVPGQTYPWDFFFCERHTSQSHLRIMTDLDLRTRSAFSVDRQVDPVTKVTRYTVHGIRPGQGCAAAQSSFASAGRFLLSGSTLSPSTQEMGGGLQFGGISVSASLGSITIDTTKITGLAAGVYKLRIQAQGDSTTFQDFSFTVPAHVDPPPPPESDSIPRWSMIYDTDADGRADQIVLRLNKPLLHTDTLEFLWPNPTTGQLDKRFVPIGQAKTDSGGLILTVNLAEPFAFGATSCPATGCGGLGVLITGSGSNQVRKPYPVQDGIPPVLTGVTVHYGPTANVPDTIKAVFSEPIQFDPSKASKLSPWLSWGRPGKDSLGMAMPYTAYDTTSPNTLDLIVHLEGSFKPVLGDSARITISGQGIVSDFSGNAPKRFAHWTAIDFWPRPLFLTAAPYTPVRMYKAEWGEPKAGPNVTILVRGSPTSPWRSLTGGTSPVDTARVTGIVLRTNRLVLGGFYLYDLQGTFVTSADVAPVNQAFQAGTLTPDDRGMYEIFFTWNGRADNGVVVPTGVYLARIFGWKIEGSQRVMVNQVHHIGWFIRKPLQ